MLDPLYNAFGAVLAFFYAIIPNEGVAIILLTITVMLVLFPLTAKSARSMLAMQRLQPEIKKLQAKHKGDRQKLNEEMMELYKENKVNPLGGCLPALVQMPIWFALYATLQTAVEFYNTRFLWFPDLSAPDSLFIHTPTIMLGPLPFVLGAAMIVQQRITPQQGMDPVQQKMMNWLMPGIFTVMMLFLPAALGVYMLTNSLLGILQQTVTQRLFPNIGAPKADAGGDIVVTKDDKADGKGGAGNKKDKDDSAAAAAALRKGKARV